MKLKMEKAVSIVFASMLLLSLLMVATPEVFAQTTTVRFYPQPPPQAEITNNGQVFTVACVVEDVADLAGLDIKIQWNTTYLQYVSHTITATVESYPDPIPPSPYAGIIHDPPLWLKDEVNETAGTYWVAFATLGGPSFDGSGTVFTMTFVSINLPFGDPTEFFYTYINFISVDLAAGAGGSISHVKEDGVIKHWYMEFEYPPLPLLKVNPPLYEASSLGEEFTIDVFLLGKNMTSGLETDLDPFWDVGGIDVYMNFDPTLIEAFDVTIDPDGTFAGFWPHGGVVEVAKEIDNVTGTVHIGFLGYGEPHTAPYGQFRVFSVDFRAILESTEFPPPSCDITLENPQAFTGSFSFDSDTGLIDPAHPVGTTWHELAPNFCEGPFELTSWEDNGDGKLSPSDQFILQDTATGYYFDYHLDYITVTLNLTQMPFPASDTLLVMDGPTHDYSPWPKTAPGVNPKVWDGFGNPYWTGTFSASYPADSVNYITVFPQIGAPYNLTEGVDYVVNPDGTIELLTPLDEPVINEHWVLGWNATDYGWPALNYICSGIESVYVKFPNGTERFARNLGYMQPPPSEWWFDPDFPYELESYWATGYFTGPFTWPFWDGYENGTEYWVNYTAPAFIYIDYNAFPDPNPRYIEFRGTYEDALIALNSPIGTEWDEAYPHSWRDYTIVGWDDTDMGGMITPSDFISTVEEEGNRTYHVEAVATDIGTSRKPWICEEDPSDPFFGMSPIVNVAGFPHPERDYCPWHNKEYSVPLPHVVANGEYVAPFKPLGGFIDVYTQYPDPYGGQGKDRPSDMFWPQKEVILYANVTYAGWPEQNKDVAFEVKDPHGTPWGVWYNRTNAVGVAFVRVRLPWPCDDPEYYFGVWKVWATVDVACVIINDTLEFKYDYKVHIWNVTTDKDEYKHCEDIVITINYGSYAMQNYNITFTVTAVDASGVPFGFNYLEVTIGGAIWCQYKDGTIELTVHVEKWARPPIGTIYVGALNGFPQNGGSAETPVYTVQIAILPEWA